MGASLLNSRGTETSARLTVEVSSTMALGERKSGTDDSDTVLDPGISGCRRSIFACTSSRSDRACANSRNSARGMESSFASKYAKFTRLREDIPVF